MKQINSAVGLDMTIPLSVISLLNVNIIITAAGRDCFAVDGGRVTTEFARRSCKRRLRDLGVVNK